MNQPVRSQKLSLPVRVARAVVNLGMILTMILFVVHSLVVVVYTESVWAAVVGLPELVFAVLGLIRLRDLLSQSKALGNRNPEELETDES